MSEELIKSLKEQLEMVIKENQRLLEKHFEQDSKIMNLNADYNRCKEENEQLHSIIKEAREYIDHAQSYGTMAQVMPHLKPYVNGDDVLEILDKVGSDKE